MVSTIINQKEYLKKYLAIGKVPGEKKKKKKLKGIQNRITIIDDDVVEEDSSKTITSEEALRIDEDAPQIVAIIDERPPSLRVDDKTKNPLWRPIGTVNHVNISKPTEDTPQKIKHEEEKIKEVKRRHKSEEKRTMKVEKTLDGKTAGLQSAQQLVEESKEIREREDQLFKNLSKDVSGENAPTVIRDRKTGKIRDFQEEEERKRKKLEEEEKNKEKYAKWGRGLAQVENREQQIQEELYEMSKPLARYADDEDLERYLKEQEREGDPMLAYIRSKKRKKAAKAGITEKPQFEGQFMPNRFGIKPGHRWDGVDRSNGYEKRWFEIQNAKRAQQEDTYKWSTEDM